jgi:hypothetical protein
VIVFVPRGRVVVVKLDLPPANVTVASTVPPELNVTVPVGVIVGEATVAVNLTDCPRVDGLREETTVVVVVAGYTAWVNTVDVLTAEEESPL